MLPYRRAVLAAAALCVANTAAQFGGQSQQYCSNQNTGSDYNSQTDIYNSYAACSDQCRSNYAFAVVQWQSCWCSDYIPADQGDTSDCNQGCPGYPDNSCGNADSGLYGYIALDKSPSGTAGGGSSSQASSTVASTSSSERVSTSTTQSSSRRERTSSSFFSSSTSSPEPSSTDSPSPTTSSTAEALTSSQTSSPETTSTSSREPSSSSDPPTSSSSPPRTTSSSSSTPPPPTSTSSSSPIPESTSSSETSEIPESATPSPVTSTRVVTISGEPVTETVTSTPMVAPDRQESESEKSSSNSLSGGAIAGIVIGILAFFALLAFGIFFFCWRRRNDKDPNNPHGYPEMATAANPRPRRNVSVLSKVGLLARSNHDPVPDDDHSNDPSSAGPSHSARHSAFYGAGGVGGSEVSPSSPLGPQSNASNSLYQMDSRRHSKPLVYDQRLNPSALFANAEANGSRISMADNTDYSRPLDFGSGRLAVRNPDPRSSFESRN